MSNIQAIIRGRGAQRYVENGYGFERMRLIRLIQTTKRSNGTAKAMKVQVQHMYSLLNVINSKILRYMKVQGDWM